MFRKSCVGVGGETAEFPFSEEKLLLAALEKKSSISIGLDEKRGATEADHMAFKSPLRAAWTSWLSTCSLFVLTLGATYAAGLNRLGSKRDMVQSSLLLYNS